MTRRSIVSLAALGIPGIGGLARAQMASRGVKAVPRGKPSGLPFNARFTDVAASAGLHAPVVFGGVSGNDYILETMGCGAGFIDYDNDGWMDVVVLTGRR